MNKTFLKENIVLVLGISLPLLLIILFMLASGLPRFFVADPHYDLLFSEGPTEQVSFKIRGKKLYFNIAPIRNVADIRLPRLYRYVAATGMAEEITFVAPDMSSQRVVDANDYNQPITTNIVIPVDPNHLPTPEDAQDASNIAAEIKRKAPAKPVLLPVAELSNIKLSNSYSAPDGYQFSAGSYCGSGMFFFGFGHSSYRQCGAMLIKDGKRIALPFSSNESDFLRDEDFTGWIVP